MSAITSSTRQEVFERDGWQCIRCGCAATEISHRKRRREGGHGKANLTAACGPCHRGWAHQNPQAAMETGFMISVHGPDPEEVPIKAFYGWVYLTNDGRIEQAGQQGGGARA